MPDPLHAVLYTSSLATGTPVTAVAAVVGAARHKNREEDLTGLLVFDGVGFLQYLEGPLAQLNACLERIRKDRRHERFSVVYQGACSARRFKGFSLGYAIADGHPPSEVIAGLEGEAALAHFLDLLPALDLHG